jgi:hypothetical protein
MVKKKKNQHIMYRCNWHPRSYSEQARELVKRYVSQIGVTTHDGQTITYENQMYRIIHYSTREGLVKYRMIKGLRRYGKRKRLI